MFDVKSLGTILGVWAHPDDEAFNMAGIMAAASRNGQKVACVTATRGEQGSRDLVRWPAETMGQVRTKELEESLKIVGCSDHVWLSYHDGELAKGDDEEGIALVAQQIKRVNPDSIFTFAPDGLTGHTDHQTISRWTVEAAQRAESEAPIYYVALTAEMYEAMREADEQFNIFFNIDQPPITEDTELAIDFELPAELAKVKSKALAAHISQYEGMLAAFGPDFFEVAQNRECFTRA